MEKNSNELTNINEGVISKLLKKISNFFRNKKTNNVNTMNNEETDKSYKSKEMSNLKSDLASEYNELQRLNMINEQFEKDEDYIEHISTEDLIKLTEMNNREIQEIENQIRREKAAV